MKSIAWISLCLGALQTTAAGDGFHSTVRGGPGPLPAGYVPPLISNGSLCMLVDHLGGQTQRAYPLFDTTDAPQRNAVYHFVAHGKASGNMYPMGQSVCAWYAGWMASALALVGDKTEPARLLREAADGAGHFGELFEINETKVSMRPWFATASGNFVYALNQMLVQCRGEELRIAPAVPKAWTDYAFKLACHGDLAIEVEVKGGRLARLTLRPGDAGIEHRRTLVLPEGLVDPAALEGSPVRRVTRENGRLMADVVFRGEMTLSDK